MTEKNTAAKAPCDMELSEYWIAHSSEIANLRGWECKCPYYCPGCLKACKIEQARSQFCPTLRTYTRYIRLVNKFIDDTPLCEITLGNIRRALKKVQEKKEWADETMRTVQSCLSILFKFASAHGDAYNILRYTSYREETANNPLDLLALISSKRPKDAIQARLQDLKEQHIHLTRSLTIWQIEKLVQILRAGISEDGRYCAMAIMLYTGARPAEVRALRWMDLTAFLDHPDRLLMQLHRTLDRRGNPKDSMKTANAYRSIPIHFELLQLLNDRYQVVLKQMGKAAAPLTERPMDAEVAKLPICCFANHFHRYCRDHEVALLAEHVFSQQLRLPRRDMYVYMLEDLIESGSKEGENSGISEQDQQLTLYVLRRNFWTWMESSTRLTDYEKRFVMGHEMELDGRNLRPEYNDMNRLWDICKKMDRCVLSKDLHHQKICVTPEMNETIYMEDRGVLHINITKEMLMRGGTLSINVTTSEVRDSVRLKSLSPVRQLGGLLVKAETVSVPSLPNSGAGINCEYENWLAHQSPKRITPESE